MLWKESVETLQLCTKVQVIEHFLFVRGRERERPCTYTGIENHEDHHIVTCMSGATFQNPGQAATNAEDF